ncbi:restriction endonuclease subunit S [Vibrio sp. 10N.222.51.C8]|uniref:restriction endonuclease subunit S n=1 Tax=Vibrio sp. 10N.222.51.C8 TaxID=3229624 RepID=UPI00354C9F35
MTSLGDVVETIMGQAPPGSECNKSGKGEVFVKAGEFGAEYPVVREWTTKPLKRAKSGDTLLCVVGATCGKVNKAIDCSIGRSVAAIRPLKNKLDENYLFYFISSWSLKLRAMSQGAAQTVISKDMIASVQIPLPPLAEQKRIAAILDKADAIRQKRKQAIDLADEFLRSVFLDMFGQQLSSRSNVVKFGDITVLDAKMVDPREEQYLDMLHIGPDRIEKVNGQLLPAMTAREEMLISKKFLFDEKYVLYSKIRPYLRKAAVPDFSALCSADMYPVKPIEGKATREFVWMLLLSDFFDSYVSSLPNRANIPKLNKSELAAFEFSLPTYREIEKFSGIAKKIKSNRIALSGGLKDATNFFNALSQKAFSGEL